MTFEQNKDYNRLLNVTAIDAMDWPAGVYVWKVYADGKEVGSGKWIKE